MAVFDIVINNTDRKGGHCLIDADRRIWGVDHGVSFHAQGKVRTVIWDFAGQPIPEELLAPLRKVKELGGLLETYLSAEEIAALERRAKRLLKEGIFPFEPRDRRAMPLTLL